MKRTRSKFDFQINDDKIYNDLKIKKKIGKVFINKVTNLKKEESKRKYSSRSTSIQPRLKLNEDSNFQYKSKKNVLLNKKSVPNLVKTQEDLNEISLKTNILNINSENNLLGPICIRLGLCCLNNYLRGLKNSVFCSRTIILSTYKSKGKIEAVAKADQNVKDIEKMIRWNKEHYIDCLRLSSEIFPHYSNIKNIEKEDRYTLDFAKKDLELAGNLARKFGHRITMHPGHYNVVGSPNEEVFQKTIIDLGMHADILDMMKMDSNSIMVVHGGGVYGDKKKTIQRWIENFKRMPEKIQKRLVIENCEKNFSIIDCLEVNKELGIPVVFDNHHFLCYKQMHPDEEFQDIRYYIKLAIDTWIKKGLRPKFHISEQAPDKQVGAHSDYIKNFPDYYLEIPKKYGIGIDIMVEAKAKEAAVFDLYQKYPKNFIGHHKIDWEKENIKELFAFDKEKMSAIK